MPAVGLYQSTFLQNQPAKTCKCPSVGSGGEVVSRGLKALGWGELCRGSWHNPEVQGPHPRSSGLLL